MNKDKQPGINFDAIMLVKESFWRDYDFPDELSVSFDIEMHWSKQSDHTCAVELIFNLDLLNGEKEVLTLESTFVGLFSIEDEAENMDIEYFIENHAPGIMFPYIREHITTITQKAGVKPVLLPPINLVALLKQSAKTD